MNLPKTPWKVQRGGLRMSISPKLVWIIDADGSEVLPWRAFDGTSYSKGLALARKIVKAVNGVSPEQEKP